MEKEGCFRTVLNRVFTFLTTGCTLNTGFCCSRSTYVPVIPYGGKNHYKGTVSLTE